MTTPEAKRPDWGRLFETAAGQSGYVTTKQAAEAGCSTHLLRKHILAGRVTRPQRGIYPLVHFPVAKHEEMVTAWLWPDLSGRPTRRTGPGVVRLLADDDVRGRTGSSHACGWAPAPDPSICSNWAWVGCANGGASGAWATFAQSVCAIRWAGGR